MIGILGGTFDPIHFGHLRTALDVVEALELEQLRFIPCGIPPHREPPAASAEQRLAMVQAAIVAEPRFVADDREIRRGGPSYMVETLESLRQDLGSEQPLALLLGLDAFAALTGWRRWQALIGLAHLVVMTRPGWSEADIKSPELRQLVNEHRPEPATGHKTAAGGVLFCPVTPLAIASTDIRRRLRAGRGARYLVPEKVLDLIQQQQIYV